jgi:hypothetical protein
MSKDSSSYFCSQTWKRWLVSCPTSYPCLRSKTMLLVLVCHEQQLVIVFLFMNMKMIN